jgi:hypothetical protein
MTGPARRLARAGAAATVLVLVAACTGGGDDDAAVQEPEVTAPPATSPPTTTPPGDIETFEVFSSKNPFIPLAGDQSGGGAGTGGTTATTTGGTTGTSPGTGGTATTTPVTGGVEPEPAQRIALLDVFTEGGEVRANVRVGTTVYKVGVGDEFATRYKVLSLSASDECGRFLFGDDAFRLCRGQQTTK